MKKLLIALTVILFTACSGNTPSATVDGYYKALKAGDTEKALSYTIEAQDPEMMAQLVDKFNTMEIELIEYKIINEEVAEDGKSAVVTTTQKAKSSFSGDEEPTNEEQKMNLELIDGEWKIRMVSVN